jgi:flagellar protein FliL
MSTEAVAGAGAPPAKKKSKLPLIIIAVAVVAGGAAAAWWFMRPQTATADKPAAAVAAAAAGRAQAIYYKFDPAFVVNFGTEGNTRYLQITLEAMSRDPKVIEEIKNNEPAIRNDLVLLFSAQQYESLVAPAGKEQLRQATLEAVRKAIAAEGARGEAVEGVYFTSFVIQ